MEPKYIVAAIVAGYIIFLFALAVNPKARWIRLRRKSLDEYFRTTGLTSGLWTWAALGATMHTAFAIPGSMGFVYKHGVAWAAFTIWTISVAAFFIYTLGPRIAIVSNKYGYVTLSEMLGDYYESIGLRTFVAIYTVIANVCYFMANIIGPAILLSYGLGGIIPYQWAIILMLVIVVAYIVPFGFRGAYWTSVIQGIWMLVCTWGAAIFLLALLGGPAAIYNKIAEMSPAHLTLPGPKGWMTPLVWMSWPFFAITLHWGIQPRNFAFYASGRSPDEIRRLALRIPIYLWLIYVPVLFLGFATLAIYPKAPDPDMAFPAVMVKYAPPILWGLLVAGALAAGMSSLDMDMVTHTGMIVRDVYALHVKKDAPEAHYIKVGRVIAVVLAILVAWFSFYKFEIITIIVGVAGTFVGLLLPSIWFAVVPCGKFRATKTGVLTGLIVGAIVALVTTFPTRLGLPKLLAHPYGIHSAFWAFTINLVLVIIISLFTKPPSLKSVEKFHTLIDQEIYGKKTA